jgi:hypothetical protein
MARKKPSSTTKKTRLIADQAVALAEYAAKALVAAEQLRIKTEAVEQFPLNGYERTTVTLLSALPASLKKKLAKKNAAFTIVEVASMVMAMSESFFDAQATEQAALLLVAKKLMDCLQTNIIMADLRAKAKVK